MFGFYRIINLVPALRVIISEESLIPKNNQNKVPFLFKTLKLLLFVKKNNFFISWYINTNYSCHFTILAFVYAWDSHI